MLFSRFFKQPKPNKFGYTAVYYDEQKEKRENRIASIEKEMGVKQHSASFDSEDFRSRFSSKVSSSRRPKRKGMLASLGGTNAKTSTRILLLAILAGIILYWQFKN